MFSLVKGQALALSLLSLFFGVGRGHCSEPTMDFIYIDSSVDEAAGGHAALRFGETVFHYQYYDEGYFLLVKDSWEEFRYQYNDLQNRSLAVVSLPLSQYHYQIIKNRFLTRYLIQEKRFAYLAQLESERIFFQALAAGKLVVPVKGLGFFDRERTGDSIALELKQLVENRLGRGYLEHLMHSLEEKLEAGLLSLQVQPLPENELSLYDSSLSLNSGMDRYFQLKSLYEAVSTLAEAHPVHAQALLRAPSDVGTLMLSEKERLRAFAEEIGGSVVGLLESARMEKGSALLIQAARFQALHRSVSEGVLISLDPFAETTDLIPLDNLFSADISVYEHPSGQRSGQSEAGGVKSERLIRSYFEQLRYERLRDMHQAGDFFFSDMHESEISYNQLESALARLWELDRAAREGTPLRIEGGALLPGKIGVVVESYEGQREQLDRLHDLAGSNRESMERQLLRIYDYNLFTRNCVTELFRTVYSAFPSQQQAREALGGYHEPGEQFSFVPFMAFDKVRRDFPNHSVELLPSFRRRMLATLFETQGVLGLLEESNTLTSKMYFSWEKDSTFLFFTDEALLTRPILGMFNFAYAAVGSLGGLVWLPVDEGTLLRRSLRGMVFSLPELVFFNIRKGTFPAIAD